jgi:hypothetical protein
VHYGACCGGAKPGRCGVKQGDWRLIKCDTLGGQVRETQLLHLAENPGERLPEHRTAAVGGAAARAEGQGEGRLKPPPPSAHPASGQSQGSRARTRAKTTRLRGTPTLR